MFVDNCSAHPDSIEASNLKLVFLPPNTTSKLQPMDAGVIQAVKTKYRVKLLRCILCRMDDCDTASELVKKVNVLDAISWMKAFWYDLSIESIKKCFTHCSFKQENDSSTENTSASENDIPVVSDSPGTAAVDEVATQLLDGVPMADFIAFDDNLAITCTMGDDWEQVNKPSQRSSRC